MAVNLLSWLNLLAEAAERFQTRCRVEPLARPGDRYEYTPGGSRQPPEGWLAFRGEGT